jgi:hypothetical protein
MADLELHNPAFEIIVNLDGKNKTITVQPEETSDGVEYYICSLNGQQLTQIRQEEDNEWEQLWGELDQQAVNEIGAVIIKNKRS